MNPGSGGVGSRGHVGANMSHWLDDAARGLAEGSHSRREVLRRGGAVAAGALFGSVTGSLAAFTPVALAAGCTNFPCLPPEQCCHDRECWNPKSEQCCPDGHTCKKVGETCCKNDCCDNAHEHCCAGECISKSRKCCGPDPAADGKKCDRNQECCEFADREHRCYSAETHYCCGAGAAACLKGQGCCGFIGAKCVETGQDCCDDDFIYEKATQKCCRGHGTGPSSSGAVIDKDKRCCYGPYGAHGCKPDLECCGATCCPKGKCHNGRCTGGKCGTSHCPPNQVCCDPKQGSCVTPYPKGSFCIGDCDGKPGKSVYCCPTGGSDACGTLQGESHPACRGGQAGCVCSNGSFCPQSGCCDVFGNCKNPC